MTAEPGPQKFYLLFGHGSGLGRGRHDTARVREEVRVGVFDAFFLGTGQRMRADEHPRGRQGAFGALDDIRLDTAHIRDQAAALEVRVDQGKLLKDHLYRRGQNHEVRVENAFLQVGKTRVDRLKLDRLSSVTWRWLTPTTSP